MFQATRRRLALWYTTVTAVLLLLFASGFYLYVRHTLIDRIDDTLKHVVEVVQRSVDTSQLAVGSQPTFSQDHSHISSVMSLLRPLASTEALDEDHIDLEWFSPTGEILWSTLSEALEIPLKINRPSQTVYLTTGYGLRQVTKAVLGGDQLLGYLRVSHPWFEVTKPIRQLSIDLGIGLTLMVASAAAIGWLLSGIAMNPVWASYQRLKQFTADASHELRSPIASIQTNVQVALTDPTLDPDTRQTWTVIERLTRRLGRLVEDLLFLARQDSGILQSPLQACALDAILLEVTEEQAPLARDKGIALLLEIADPPTTDPEADHWFQVWGNSDQLARLFTNLVTNGICYTAAGGTVTVSLQQLAKPHAQIQVTVKDSGHGIPPDALPHLFDRFYRVDPARTHTATAAGDAEIGCAITPMGSGLGLAISQAIVENHQGQIRVDSTLGQGTVFTVVLPVFRADPQAIESIHDFS
jgi:OmpR-family two-component system manganese-sensing sensor histidine kinase